MKTAELALSVVIAATLAACASQRTITVQEYHITNTAERCAGRTACADVPAPGECVIFVNAHRATEADYGAAVRKCWEGRV